MASTKGNNMSLPLSARVLVAVVVLALLGAIGLELREPSTLGSMFWIVLGASVIASRFKVSLPGVNGTMSLNLPFILLGAMQLHALEAIVIAVASAIAQSLWNRSRKATPVQYVFNAATVGTAAALACRCFHALAGNPDRVFVALAPAAAAAVYFLVNTLAVAAIISLSEGGNAARIWASIAELTYTNYLLAAALGVAITSSGWTTWQLPVLLLPVLYPVYRSFRRAFQNALASASEGAAKTAAAHA